MSMTRRDFLKAAGAAIVTLAVADLGFDQKQAYAEARKLKVANLKPSPTICPYCSVGCGILVYSDGEDVVYTEGDPDHPINEGTLCSKGTTVRQVYTAEKRVTKPLYRAPGSDKWEEKDWDWMMSRIVEKIKKTRDQSFETVSNGITVNHTEAIACLGGAALDNEETYLLFKLMRGLGLNYLEHQARI